MHQTNQSFFSIIYTVGVVTLFSLFFSSCGPKVPLKEDGTQVFYADSLAPYYHGVASGDPMKDRVVIWTRITPPYHQTVKAEWEVAEDDSFEKLIAKGRAQTDSTLDYTLKVDVEGLTPGRVYYYRFKALDAYSVFGRTKTLPAEGVSSVKLAVASCSNFEAGYFNAYMHLAEEEHIDAVLHLGDYIYEYEPKRYGDTSLHRFHLPPHEIIQLSDYRTRYAQYRIDPDLQAAHRMHPFITIWDDHEIANNSFVEGAENHQEEEGDYEARKEAARKAYFEWLPIRDVSEKKIYRDFQFGDMADLVMLDERIEGRTAPVDSISHPDYEKEERSMLGKNQLEWFKEKLSGGNAQWRLIGNQVIFADLHTGHLFPHRPKNLDAWDGYPSEKKDIESFILDQNIQNVIFLTGDTHSSWAFDIPKDKDKYLRGKGDRIAVEFGTPSITSANFNESFSGKRVREIEIGLMDDVYNPHLRYANLRHHGYLLLSLTKENATAEWRYVDRLDQVSDGIFVGMTYEVEAKKPVL